MSLLRRASVLVAVGAAVAACGALQGLDKFDKCNDDEECGLTGGGATDGPVTSEGSVVDGAIKDAACGSTVSDPNHCGRCGNVCATGLTCVNSQCTCTLTTCGGSNGGPDASTDGGAVTCVDTQKDPQNCGGCGLACNLPNAVATCDGATCALSKCSVGFVDCNSEPKDGCECPADSCLAGKLCAKRVFTTSLVYDGNLGGLAGADMKCQARAVAAALPGTYKAWLSDAAATPNTRFTKSTIPYRLVDGTLVANDYTDLTDGTIAAPLNKTESGGAAPTTAFCGPNKVTPWSSTSATGAFQAGGTCTNWTDTTVGGAQWGDGNAISSSWAAECGGGACGGTFMAPLYCFQQ